MTMLDLDAIRERDARCSDVTYESEAAQDRRACLAEIERLRGLVERAEAIIKRDRIIMASPQPVIGAPAWEESGQWLTDLRGGEDDRN